MVYLLCSLFFGCPLLICFKLPTCLNIGKKIADAFIYCLHLLFYRSIFIMSNAQFLSSDMLTTYFLIPPKTDAPSATTPGSYAIPARNRSLLPGRVE